MNTDEALAELTAAAPFTGWVAITTVYPDPWDNELEPARAAIEAALAEAGYPDADVYIENGIMVDGAPADVVARAEELVNLTAPRSLP